MIRQVVGSSPLVETWDGIAHCGRYLGLNIAHCGRKRKIYCRRYLALNIAHCRRYLTLKCKLYWFGGMYNITGVLWPLLVLWSIFCWQDIQKSLKAFDTIHNSYTSCYLVHYIFSSTSRGIIYPCLIEHCFVQVSKPVYKHMKVGGKSGKFTFCHPRPDKAKCNYFLWRHFHCYFVEREFLRFYTYDGAMNNLTMVLTAGLLLPPTTAKCHFYNMIERQICLHAI